MPNPTDSIATLADIYAADFWELEAAAMRPENLRERHLQMLYEIRRDIHILAMGIQELLDEKRSN